MKDFDPLVGARKAASVIVLRDREAGDGFEVLMMRRAERDGDFRSGAAVFPGGALDVADAQAHVHVLGWDDAQASARMGLPGGGLDYLVAAARECFEEVGLLYATPLDEPRLATAHAHWRAPMQQGRRTVSALCAELEVRIDLREWHCWSHWLTPPGHPKRFDTRFFVARAPAAQQAEADFGEALELLWLTPAQALDRAFGLKLLPVTRRTLQQLGTFACVQAVLDHAATLSAYPMTMPRRALSAAGELRILLPDEPPYAEVARLDPTGQQGALGEIVPGRAVRLAEGVIRVTAPNPGVMTGPGTNSYLVGDAVRQRWTVIDPGPADPAHLRALLAAAPGPIERILVTHTHKDHSPGAAALARATGAPVLGRRALHPQGQDESFTPQHEVTDGEIFPVGDGLALRAVHTPGHASNHLCFLLPHERMLFTGDHVMQGSTVVINPPDGDMAAYLDALRGLLALPIDWLAPGHGFLVAQPRAVIEALIRHRLAREARVLEAMRALAPAPIDTLLPRVYADVPPALHPMARRSLLAHLLKLQGDGIATLNGESWGFVQPGQGVQRPSCSSS
jgi:glyoxylase-like metal-dependent hydrolase (beta-lactamase superfamily II)/8-oxo-dGTP pyrophosphatase MutT (NUDIX family)